MIQADASRFAGTYGDTLKSAFVQRGLLSLALAPSISSPQWSKSPRGARAKGFAPDIGRARRELPQIELAGEQYGLGSRPLFVAAPAQPRRFQSCAAALDIGPAASPSSEKASRSFVEDLFRRGRVDVKSKVKFKVEIVNPMTRKTHELVEDGRGATLRRRCFGCGFD